MPLKETATKEPTGPQSFGDMPAWVDKNAKPLGATEYIVVKRGTRVGAPFSYGIRSAVIMNPITKKIQTTNLAVDLEKLAERFLLPGGAENALKSGVVGIKLGSGWVNDKSPEISAAAQRLAMKREIDPDDKKERLKIEKEIKALREGVKIGVKAAKKAFDG